mgnify:CR=1 FL=1
MNPEDYIYDDLDCRADEYIKERDEINELS